jgi:hypothetical protein
LWSRSLRRRYWLRRSTSQSRSSRLPFFPRRFRPNRLSAGHPRFSIQNRSRLFSSRGNLRNLLIFDRSSVLTATYYITSNRPYILLLQKKYQIDRCRAIIPTAANAATFIINCGYPEYNRHRFLTAFSPALSAFVFSRFLPQLAEFLEAHLSVAPSSSYIRPLVLRT